MTKTISRDVRLRTAIERGDSKAVREMLPSDPRSLNGACFFDACGAFMLGEQKLANELIEKTLEINAGYVIADWFNTISDLCEADLLARDDMHPWFYLQYASKFFFDGRLREAKAVIDHARTLSNGESPVCDYRLFELRCEADLRVQDFRQDAVAFRLRSFLAEQYDGERRPWTEIYSGCLSFRERRYEDALRAFQNFVNEGPSPSFTSMGAYSFRPDLASGRKLNLPELDVIQLPGVRRATFVYCSDANYFQQFLPLVVMTAFQSGIDANFHFHVAGSPDMSVLDLLGIDKEWLRSHIGLSKEIDLNLGKAFYASVRFLRANALLDLYSQPLIFSDIDSAFNSNGCEFLSALENVSGGLLRKEVENHMPWRSITANLFFVRNDRQTREFLDQIARILHGVFSEASTENTSILWWCDQNALGIADALCSDITTRFTSFFDIRARAGLPLEFAPNHTQRKQDFIKRHLLVHNKIV